MARCAICDGVTNPGTVVCDICAAELRRFVREASRVSLLDVMAEYDLTDTQATAALRQSGCGELTS